MHTPNNRVMRMEHNKLMRNTRQAVRHVKRMVTIAKAKAKLHSGRR